MPDDTCLLYMLSLYSWTILGTVKIRKSLTVAGMARVPINSLQWLPNTALSRTVTFSLSTVFQAGR